MGLLAVQNVSAHEVIRGAARVAHAPILHAEVMLGVGAANRVDTIGVRLAERDHLADQADQLVKLIALGIAVAQVLVEADQLVDSLGVFGGLKDPFGFGDVRLDVVQLAEQNGTANTADAGARPAVGIASVVQVDARGCLKHPPRDGILRGHQMAVVAAEHQAQRAPVRAAVSPPDDEDQPGDLLGLLRLIRGAQPNRFLFESGDDGGDGLRGVSPQRQRGLKAGGRVGASGSQYIFQ